MEKKFNTEAFEKAINNRLEVNGSPLFFLKEIRKDKVGEDEVDEKFFLEFKECKDLVADFYTTLSFMLYVKGDKVELWLYDAYVNIDEEAYRHTIKFAVDIDDIYDETEYNACYNATFNADDIEGQMDFITAFLEAAAYICGQKINNLVDAGVCVDEGELHIK